MIRKFVDDHPDLTIKTQAIYKGILNDFIKYSPAVSLMDLHKFILHRFPNESFIKDDELYLKGNAIKYCNLITRFLKINSKKIHMKIHILIICMCVMLNFQSFLIFMLSPAF